MIKKIFAFIVVISLITSVSVSAVDMYEGYNYPVDIDINGNFIKCLNKPVLINGTTYIPLRAFSDAIGGEILWNEDTEAATFNKGDHSFVFFTGKDYCLVDNEEKNYPSIVYNDLTFIPLRAVSEVLGYEILWDGFYLTVKITAPDVEVLEYCKDYSYTYEDILYLGRMTQLEGGSQPMESKIGIASTIVNRVKSSQFPNTVKDVIMDTKYGVQFPPAHTDKINNTPSYHTMFAAKCALFGINPVRNSLYFMDTARAKNTWVHKNRPFYKSIGAMSFYE